jgi:hypothetical protein
VVSFVWGALILGAVLVLLYAVIRHRRLRARREIAELLDEYFRGGVPVERLGQRARELTHRRFTGSPLFYSIAAAAFHGAADDKLGPQAHTREDESNLLRLWAALQKEFGLTDRYQIEAWRPGRE